ncbi:MAG: PQQ-binding-like beta-propeller repeat protein [Bacteroidota bacterium]
MNKNVKIALLSLGVAASSIAFMPGHGSIKNIIGDEQTAAVKTDEGTDVLKQVLDMNAETKPKPTKNFKPGHIAYTDLQDHLKTTANGFVIKLPSSTNVPTPIIQDGKIYVSGGFGSKEYYAFDAKTGSKVWALSLDDDGPSAGVIEDDILVFNSESCTIFACDVKTGRYLWSHWLGDPLMSTPTIANGKVFTSYPAYYGGSYNEYDQNVHTDVPYYGDDITMKPTHVLACFDLKSGKVLWQKWIDSDIMTAPVAVGDNLYFSTFSGILYKVGQASGSFVSAKNIKATSAPVIDGDKIIITRRNDKGNKCMESIAILTEKESNITAQYANKDADYLNKDVQSKSLLKTESNNLDAGNGFGNGAPMNSNWSVAYDNIGQSNVSSLQAFQGSRTLYFSGMIYNSMGDEVICTDASNGKAVWKTKVEGDLHNTGGFLATPPIKAGEKIIVATFAGQIKVINPEDGKVEKTFNTGKNIRYAPVCNEGWIYVTTTTGEVVAINSQDQSLTGWTMWGANAAHTNFNTN